MRVREELKAVQLQLIDSVKRKNAGEVKQFIDNSCVSLIANVKTE